MKPFKRFIEHIVSEWMDRILLTSMIVLIVVFNAYQAVRIFYSPELFPPSLVVEHSSTEPPDILSTESTQVPMITPVATATGETEADLPINPTVVSSDITPAPSDSFAVTATPGLSTMTILIPTLDIDVSLISAPIVDGIWDFSEVRTEIAHLDKTAFPGDTGNIVLAGHATLRSGAGPFYHLARLTPGDLITIQTQNQSYIYSVVWIRFVEPDDVQVTYPTAEPVLTLITCSSWDRENREYAQRVAVRAEFVELIISDDSE